MKLSTIRLSTILFLALGVTAAPAAFAASNGTSTKPPAQAGGQGMMNGAGPAHGGMMGGGMMGGGMMGGGGKGGNGMMGMMTAMTRMANTCTHMMESASSKPAPAGKPASGPAKS